MRRLETALGAAVLLVGCGPDPRVEPLAGLPATGAEASDPALAVDPASGDALVAWVAGDSAGWHLYFARSADGARTWSVPVRVTDRSNDIHPHGESSPRLIPAPAPPGGVIGLAWTNSIPATGRRWPASNIRFARSADGGRTWSRAVTLNDDTAAGPGGHIFHGAAWVGDSALLVAWLDERAVPTAQQAAPADPAGETDASVYLATSRDLGRTWLPNRPLWSAACPCCRVSLARGPRGEVLAAWREHFPGNVRDVVVAPIADAPTSSRLVHADGWVYPGCPHTGPGVAWGADGTVHVTWYTGAPGATGVFYAARGAGSTEFAPPVPIVTGRGLPAAHPRIAALPGGDAVIATEVASGGSAAVLVARVSVRGQVAPRIDIPGSRGADHPEVVALDDSTVVVAWTEKEGDRRNVRFARVAFP